MSPRRRRRAGAAVVEFALVFPLFLMFAVGSIETMSMLSAWSTLQWVSDTVARQQMLLGATGATPATAVAAAHTMAASVGYTSTGGVTFTATNANCVSGKTTQCMTIAGSYTYRFNLATLGMASVRLRSQAVAPLL